MNAVNPEILILKSFIQNPETYKLYYQYINLTDIDLPELKQLFKELEEYYNHNEKVTLEAFYLHLKAKLNLNDVHKDLFQQTHKAQVPENFQEILTNYKTRSLAKQLALLSFNVHEGRKQKEDILDFIGKFDNAAIEPEEPFVNQGLHELYEQHVLKPGLRWRLPTLNRMLGSLRQGDFGFIFARPESGKTTFLSSEVSYFAEQTQQPILWCNNEEDGKKVKLRIIQATLVVTQEDLFRNLQENDRRYKEITGDRVKILDSANIHRSEVERLCDQLQPACVVFDQLDKIKGFHNEREDLRLGSIYVWAREIAKEYCPVIGVTQANGEGEGKRWLTMDYVSSAKTAKQAEADWILGIGKSNEEGMDYVRHLHLSKNKLSGDPDTDPNLRHGKMDCLIVPQIARYKDIQ